VSTSTISHWYKWSIDKRGNSFLIRRYRKVDSKVQWQSYPKEKYKHLSSDEIQLLLKRLNTSLELERRNAEARYDFNHIYVNKRTLEGFEELLKTRSNSLENINTVLSCLKLYTLDYFIHKKNLPDPNYWKKNEAGFGKYLLSKKISSSYIKRIVLTTNRFIKFLHEAYPDEIRLTVLNPISRNVLKEKDLESKNHSRKKFIDAATFQFIIERIDERLIPAVKLAYYFGLRRAEVLGLRLDDVYEDSLNIERQLIRLGPTEKCGPLKNRTEERSIPYWFINPEQTYKLIETLEIVHPDTLGDMFKAEMTRLKLPFQFHDLRRTFITMSLRSYHYLDVKLAAGHSKLETTNKYIQDDRGLQRKKFVPTLKSVR
jgi:integrase